MSPTAAERRYGDRLGLNQASRSMLACSRMTEKIRCHVILYSYMGRKGVPRGGIPFDFPDFGGFFGISPVMNTASVLLPALREFSAREMSAWQSITKRRTRSTFSETASTFSLRATRSAVACCRIAKEILLH